MTKLNVRLYEYIYNGTPNNSSNILTSRVHVSFTATAICSQRKLKVDKNKRKTQISGRNLDFMHNDSLILDSSRNEGTLNQKARVNTIFIKMTDRLQQIKE